MSAPKDEYELFFARERARYRGKLPDQRSLWQLERWAQGPPGRASLGP